MARIKQDRKEEWERERVQRVLNYHNKKYKIHIAIKGRATDVYPHLKEQKKQFNWDWVCHDTKTDDEIAVEVKRITDEKLEVSYNTIWDILYEVKNDLLNRLPGTFLLSIDISCKNYYLPIRGQQNKQRFKDILCEAIFQTAQKLKLEEDRGLIPQIREKLPFALPDSFSCGLIKVNDEGSMLQLGSSVGGSWSPRLKKYELKEFGKMVSHANEQLGQATNAKRTILVIIEEGLRMAIPETVAVALEQINPDSYSQINHIYYVSGKKVEEIPLPTP